jgi:hypothetical protein
MLRSGKNGLEATGQFFANSKGTPSDAIRAFHRQVLEKASEALTLQNTEVRDSSAIILALPSDSMAEAKKDILNFRNFFDKKYSAKRRSKDAVYCMSIQFFQMDMAEGKS